MTMGISGFKSKKDLKAAVGQDISGNVVETSMFGLEFKYTGDNTFVGPDAYHDRRWFATVTTKDGVIVKVK